MSWAGLERVARIKGLGYLKNLNFDPVLGRDRALEAIEAATRAGSIRNGPKDPSFDAALSLASILRLPRPELCLKTVEGIRTHLALGPEEFNQSFFYRYIRKDDFGQPHSAFVICSFWVAQALAGLGKKEDARKILEDAVKAANHLGLLSEHYLPASQSQFGNFPQAYSHVGLINAAFALSPPWSDVL